MTGTPTRTPCGTLSDGTERPPRRHPPLFQRRSHDGRPGVDARVLYRRGRSRYLSERPLTYAPLLTDAPRDRILLETDAPYLPPTPHRGTAERALRISPLVAEQLAAVWNASPEAVGELTARDTLPGAGRFPGVGGAAEWGSKLTLGPWSRSSAVLIALAGDHTATRAGRPLSAGRGRGRTDRQTPCRSRWPTRFGGTLPVGRVRDRPAIHPGGRPIRVAVYDNAGHPFFTWGLFSDNRSLRREDLAPVLAIPARRGQAWRRSAASRSRPISSPVACGRNGRGRPQDHHGPAGDPIRLDSRAERLLGNAGRHHPDPHRTGLRPDSPDRQPAAGH